jgi:Myb-like DNA-binding domain
VSTFDAHDFYIPDIDIDHFLCTRVYADYQKKKLIFCFLHRLLTELVRKHGEGKWSLLAKDFPTRNGKNLRERWNNHVKPDINKVLRITVFFTMFFQDFLITQVLEILFNC